MMPSSENVSLRLHSNQRRFYRTILLGVALAVGGALAKAFDWFHDLGAWLTGPIPTWVFIAGVVVICTAISELKEIVLEAHERRDR